MHPVERLLNLTALLLESPRPLTFGQIRERIPAYQQGALTTAKRMFERDKDVLRDAGIPVELVPTDPFEVEEGYTIPKERLLNRVRERVSDSRVLRLVEGFLEQGVMDGLREWTPENAGTRRSIS